MDTGVSSKLHMEIHLSLNIYLESWFSNLAAPYLSLMGFLKNLGSTQRDSDLIILVSGLEIKYYF